MPGCRWMLHLWTATLVVVVIVVVVVEGAFWAGSPLATVLSGPSSRRHPPPRASASGNGALDGNMAKMKVEVCGFKDCKRAGGGPRLETLIAKLLVEKDLVDSIQVESCDCQGECGYGPNLVVDGRIVNDVKGREAVLKALGIEE